MRYLLLLLALAFVGCGWEPDRETVLKADAMSKNCEARGIAGRLPESDSQALCVAQVISERCMEKFRAGEIAGEEDWSNCLAPEVVDYCAVNYLSDKVTYELCTDIIIKTAMDNDPFTELVYEALGTVMKMCNSRHQSGDISTWTAKARCLNEGYDRVIRQYQVFPVIGKFRQLERKRLAIAGFLDSNSGTESDTKQNWEHYRVSCWALPVLPECKVK